MTKIRHHRWVAKDESFDCSDVQHYMTNIRTNIPTTSQNSDVALVNSRGKSLGHYIGLLKTITRRYGLKQLPTLTACRKAGATAFVEQGATPDQMEKLGDHMAHDPSTSRQYYKNRHRHDAAITTHAAIQQTMGKHYCELYN